MSDLPEQHQDATGFVKASRGDHHQHKINLGVHPGLAKPTDWEPGGPEVPARAARERVNPSVSAKQRRAGLINTTEIRSPSGSPSHVPEPSPRKL
jgi:hypothetical protein